MPLKVIAVFSRFRSRIYALLTSTQVRPFIWLYYIPLMLWGIYGTFFSAPITFVRPVMGLTAYNAWIWLHIAGPLVVMCGMRFEDISKRGRLGYWGIGMQTGGHFAMFWVLLAYEMSATVAAIRTPVIMYSCFALSPYVIGCLLLSAQSAIHRILVERVNRDMAYHKAIREIR